MMIAFGIQLSIDSGKNGVVTFEAKTDELAKHYIRDFGARPVASLYPDGPKTFMIADQAAKDYFFFVSFLRKEKDHMKEYNKDFDIDFFSHVG